MKSIHFIFIACVLTLITEITSAQTAKSAKALAAFNAGEYFTAIDLYKSAYNNLTEKTSKAEMLFQIAECYRLVSEPRQAELWYTKAIAKGISNPLAILYLADAQKMNMKYAEAKESYKKYKDNVSKDPRADDGIRSCELAQKWMENPSGYQVDNMKFFNSKQNDFCPAYGSEDYSTVYFTSSRDGSTGKSISGATGQNFADIFVSKMDRKGTWSQPVLVSNSINTEFDDGSPCLSKDFKTMYFTRCEKAKSKNFGCAIFQSEIQGEEWSKAKKILIASDSIIVAHPAISPDELTLYFTSDMEGGEGGKDIWKVTRAKKGDEWGTPENMGAQINTPGDEEFPYVHSDGTFYFSSNGQVGMGGLDIFKATRKPDGNWNIENMGYPINSNADDFAIVFQNETEKGLFSSNRTTKGDDDIYAFTLPPLKFNVVGVVKDEKTDQAIPDATVKSISSDGITIDNRTDKNGAYHFALKPNTDYIFIASHEGYLNGKERETTKGLDHSRDFKTTILLASIAKAIELPNIFYDFNKWDLRPESMVALDKLVETLNDNPSITIELMSHTDSRGNDADNMILSQKRAQSVVDYLIQKGIATDRLVAKGYGESDPKVVDKKLADQYPFLKEGQKLDDDVIKALTDADLQEVAHQINRRTEFKVLRTDYKPKKK